MTDTFAPLVIALIASGDIDTPCFWDARTRGNGQGQPFAVLNGVALYFHPKENHRD